MTTAPVSPLLKASSDVRSVAHAFAEMLSDLQIEQYKPSASRQQQRLRERMESRLSLVASYLTGSYRRNTQIFPLNDIDVLLVLCRETYAELLGNPSTGVVKLLDLLEAALREAYPKSEIERFDRCIRLQLAGTGIGFDVIPAFQDGEDVFLIPDSRIGRFIATNPKEHERVVSDSNQRVCDGMLVPLVKLCKAVNEHIGKPLTGYHVEMMAYYALTHAPHSYPCGVAFLLDDFATRVWFAVRDPWPFGLDADEYLSWEKRSQAATSLRKVADHVSAAIAAEEAGDIHEAHRHWAEVFGEWYPVTPPPPEKAARLTLQAAAIAVSGAARISATSVGLVRPAPGLRSARSATSHGGMSPHRSWERGGGTPDEAWHERQIERALRQFSQLERITPAEAAADPAIWPVTDRDVDALYAVLVGDQYTNIGIRHRLLVTIPKDAPAVEPAIYDLREYRHATPYTRGWKNVRGLRHHWGGRVMCTHAARDRWDGQLPILLIWAVDWLFRQDYHQKYGRWLGAEIDAKGRLIVNGSVQREDPRLVRPGQVGRRVPV